LQQPHATLQAWGRVAGELPGGQGPTYPSGIYGTPATALPQKYECLRIALTQKGLGWKAVAQPPLPMALLAQRHRDWGCLLALPPQTSNVA